ncbi:isoprenoid synthase domain-containing protein [Pilobolus umbonatus]|nr:isoprenoid synthase domain-containing protein [Pilobolus umbonatus]
MCLLFRPIDPFVPIVVSLRSIGFYCNYPHNINMLPRIIRKTVTKQPITLVAGYHHSQKLLNKLATQSKETDSGSTFNKLSEGIQALKSTLLNAPPLRRVTTPVIETLPFTGTATTWEDAVKEAQSLVNTVDQERIFDPVKLIGKDLWELKGNITSLLGSGHPFIHTMGKHYLEGDTNRIRPLLVLLMAKATSIAPKSPDYHVYETDDVVNYTSVDIPILATQRRLAEISEMIYTSSLMHYDILDTEQQQILAKNTGFGNKLAVLAGDFLLARASLALAQLKNAECIELIATCIANLVEGEFMQLRNESTMDSSKAFEYYLEKIYKKTGSLIAQSCKASSVLGGGTGEVTQIAYNYGRHLGLAFQLVTDIDMFVKSVAKMDKNMAGWISAPVLLAWKEVPELGPIIERQLSEQGDMEKVRALVYKSNGLKKTLELINEHTVSAINEIKKLPPSDAQSALIQLANNLSTKKD